MSAGGDDTFRSNKNLQLLWLAKSLSGVGTLEEDEGARAPGDTSNSVPSLRSESRIMLERRIDHAMAEPGQESPSFKSQCLRWSQRASSAKREFSLPSKNLLSEQDRAVITIQTEWKRSRLIHRTAVFIAGTSEEERTEVLSELNARALAGVQALSFILPAGLGHARFLRKLSLQRLEYRKKLIRFEAECAQAAEESVVNGLQDENDSSLGSPGGSVAAQIKARSTERRSPSTIAANVVATMRASIANDAEMQQIGCAALASIAKGTAVDAQAVLGAKGGDAVLQAMRSFPTAVELQCEGCVAVINLVKHNLAGASQLADAGAATCIVDAMRIHTASADLMSWALAALGFIAQHGEDVARAMVAAEAHIEAVVAMTAARDGSIDYVSASGKGVETVLRWGIVLLGNLAQHDAQTASVVTQTGAPACVAAAMRARPMNAEIQCDGAVALLNMAKHDEDAAAAVTRAGGPAALVMALWSELHREDVVRWAGSALGHLAKHSAVGAEEVAANGGVAAIVAAMQSHKASAVVQRSCCVALFYISKHDSAKIAKQVAAASTKKALKSAVEQHGDDAFVDRWGRLTLTRLEALTQQLVTIAEQARIESEQPPRGFAAGSFIRSGRGSDGSSKRSSLRKHSSSGVESDLENITKSDRTGSLGVTPRSSLKKQETADGQGDFCNPIEEAEETEAHEVSAKGADEAATRTPSGGASRHLRPRRRNSAGRIIQRIANAVTSTSRNSTTTDLKNDDTTNANDNNFTSSGNVNTNSVPSGGLETPRSENDQVWPDASSKSKRRLSLLFRRGQKRASALEQRVVAETPEFALQRERFASWRRTGRSASSVHGRHADDGGSAEDHELTAAQRTHSRFYFGV